MEQYISKSVLVAEIDQRIEDYKSHKIDDSYHDGLIFALEDLRDDFINTFEVKEVDLDALGVLANHLIACNAHGVTPKYSDRELDFLEGLANNKAQKGEEL